MSRVRRHRQFDDIMINIRSTLHTPPIFVKNFTGSEKEDCPK